ncbi:3-dehydroquinate synthase [hydrothermal vent metagenome]|uniref:3-dehydroquinate synthase n=1 Tax=hydrothermal vent metagenome TaxID=652676 RepID=A0A3B0TLQ8_9ZZZZ
MERVAITDGSGNVVSTIQIVDGATALSRGELLLPGDLSRHRVGVIVQPSVTRIASAIEDSWRDRGASVRTITVPDREAAKTLSVAEDCFVQLNELGLTRDDMIVGIGGGAATDLAGFVAATYLRGVASVLFPTTMLAAVDASIGGKTAVNVGGKNLVGVFHHPDRVIIDLEILRGLPREILLEGSAEAVKAGFIADPDLVALYAADGLSANIADVLVRAVRVKAGIVSEDFRERGVRGTLNFGHTVGHAIETLTGLSHGHSVAIGMVAASYSSAKQLGFPETPAVVEILQKLGLPTVLPAGVSRSDILELIRLDKKRDHGGIRMALLSRIGECVVMSVDDATVLVGLTAIGVTN